MLILPSFGVCDVLSRHPLDKHSAATQVNTKIRKVNFIATTETKQEPLEYDTVFCAKCNISLQQVLFFVTPA
jgi:hypothetical protein